MDCQQLIVYGLLLLVGLYILKDVCGINLEGYENSGGLNYSDFRAQNDTVFASEPGNQGGPLKVNNLQTDKTSCYPQNALQPEDLLPDKQAQEFNDKYPVAEGILKGVNFLEAGHHIGVNTVGQSLRNANLGLRPEPANPQAKVSPWSNSTIGPDLLRKPLVDGGVCNNTPPVSNETMDIQNNLV